MALDKKISYIFNDPADTSEHWQGFEQDFDSAVISVADKMAEQVDLRTVHKKEGDIKFIMITDL